ncbi:acetate--CoA ligase [Saccharospirillum impatiens]|uniref:acetate--CoA ligase n=1 Tax=Saccharospirillum impatiens TaxID=169438 RepID=UPI000412E774|nr:acetate--CoA ligase [Saccharospirillum impatiens]
MTYPIVSKALKNSGIQPNLNDYDTVFKNFRWQQAADGISLPAEADSINIAAIALDRHQQSAKKDQVALRFLSKDPTALPEDITYLGLWQRANQFANVMTSLGLQKGDRVFCLCGRTPDLYMAIMGTLKAGCVFSPLFSAFGPEPIRARMEIGNATAIVTTTRLYKKKLADWITELPSLRYVLLLDSPEDPELTTDQVLSLQPLLADSSAKFNTVKTQPEDMALLHFTSGTTGKPKGAIHVHQAVLAHYMTAAFALDLHPQDIYWCTADPGWVTGTSYGIIAPLCHGVTLVIDEADFDAERWYRILQDQAVTVWYTAPTAIRMLMKYGRELADQHDLSSLRFLASVGEPLNPEAVIWGMETLGLPFHDNWWQTETGGIMIANYASMDIKPGSMGRPVPGIEAAIAERTENGGMRLINDPDETGELVLKAGWPSMFRGYLHEDERYRKAFIDGWYFTGDLARKDDGGYFWFIGRADDVIKSSGHLIGPFEVESVLMEHPGVAEAGVIGIPDEVGGEVVKAFVGLKPGYTASDALAKDILGLARKRLGSAVAPKSLAFSDNLPKTRSGKIMRRLLKARELGLPEGDTSTLEGSGQ